MDTKLRWTIQLRNDVDKLKRSKLPLRNDYKPNITTTANLPQ